MCMTLHLDTLKYRFDILDHTCTLDDLMPYSDLKPLTAKNVYQIWQKEWDETILVSNKFHEILPKLADKLLSFCKTLL